MSLPICSKLQVIFLARPPSVVALTSSQVCAAALPPPAPPPAPAPAPCAKHIHSNQKYRYKQD